MNDGVKRGSMCEVVGQAERGCDALERGSDCDSVDRALVEGEGVRLQSIASD